MSVPTMPPGPATQSGNQGPYVGYPYGPPSTPAPMGTEPKKKSYAGLITGAIAGVAVVGLVAGSIPRGRRTRGRCGAEHTRPDRHR